MRPAVFKRAFQMGRRAFGKLYKAAYGGMGVAATGCGVTGLSNLARVLPHIASPPATGDCALGVHVKSYGLLRP